MSARTPEPRIPLEPEEYPLYRPPSRLGCSGLSIVTLAALLMFAVLFWQVTPRITRGITGFNPQALLGGESTGTTTPGPESSMQTQTPEPVADVVTPTLGLIATPTPERVCAKVTATGGSGVALRAAPQLDAKRVVPGGVGEGAFFEVTGPDVTGGKDSSGNDIVWKPVVLPNDGRGGFVQARYLVEAPCP